jgi:hypothetical protein
MMFIFTTDRKSQKQNTITEAISRLCEAEVLTVVKCKILSHYRMFKFVSLLLKNVNVNL